MVLIRKKLNKSAIVLIAVFLVAAIALVVCHFVGVIDLSFLGIYAQSLGMIASDSPYMAAAILGGSFVLGFGACYLLKDYIIGMEVNSNMPVAGGYNPLPSQPSSQSDVVVS